MNFEPTNPFPRRASLPLHFIIVGANVTGLACAYNLHCAGHTVTVFEQDDGVGSVRENGGVKCPPNMSKILAKWGLEEKLRMISTRCPRIAFNLGTGECISALVFHKEIVKELGAELFFLSYSDLHVLLFELILSVGIRVKFQSRVAMVHTSTPTPGITLEDGTKHYGDIIVGADGPQSGLRPYVVGRHEKEEAGPFPLYSAIIPASRLRGDPELEDLLKDPTWNTWMGDEWTVQIHPASGGDALALYCIWPESKDRALPGWRTKVHRDTIDEWPGLEPKIQRFMRMPYGGVVQAKHIIQEPLDDWYNEETNIVLMGEAAHALNPGALHAAALCIEDAAVFGGLFSHIQQRDQIPKLLAAYQELRSERCKTIRESEYRKQQFICLPPGPLREERNASLKKANSARIEEWEEVEEDWLRENWGLEFEGPFNYDAYEAVDEWWAEWGVIEETVKSLKRDSMPLELEVVRVEDVKVEQSGSGAGINGN